MPDNTTNNPIPAQGSISPLVKAAVAAKYRKGRAGNPSSAPAPDSTDGSSILLPSSNALTSEFDLAALQSLAPTLIYLRVSSKDQMNTALDIDRNGLSIATQEAECRNKVAAVGGDLVRPPFIEAGVSGKDVEHRPAFKDMLAFIKKHPGVKYVVTYNRARAFRNQFDAAIHVAQLQKFGIRLITVKDDFGVGPAAVAMEGMLDVMNGLMNTMNGLDIQTKMGYKATHGGTIGRAPLGYLNVKKKVEGKDVSTVILDPKRAQLVKKAWELYATGEYTLERLEATMADMGLTSRPSSRNPHEHPVSDSKLRDMLEEPYYLGYIVYGGDIYPGNHEPLVDEALFEKVQQVLNLRSAKGQRDRVHQHYLKGMLFCERCHHAGRTSRLIFTQPTGRAGKKYGYFVCRGKQDGTCDLPHLRVADVEQAVVEHYQTLQLPDNFISDIQDKLDDALGNEQTATKELHASLSRQLKKLGDQENRLVDALADDTLPADTIRAKLRDLKIQKGRIQAGLVNTQEELALGAGVLRDAVHLLADPYQMYKDHSNTARRLLNQAFYKCFYVDERHEPLIPGDDKTPLFEDLHHAKHVHQQMTAATTSSPEGIASATRRAGHATKRPTDGQNSHQGQQPDQARPEATQGRAKARYEKPPRCGGFSSKCCYC